MLGYHLSNLGATDIPCLAVLIYVGFYYAYASHEFGHYFTARLTGLKVTRVVIGHCGTIYLKKHAGTLFVIRVGLKIWRECYVRLAAQDTTVYAMALFLVAGIIVNITSGAILIATGIYSKSIPLLIIGGISLTCGVGQLSSVHGTDGRYMWSVLRNRSLE